MSLIQCLCCKTGESETFLQKAIQEQGRGRILDTIQEIQERHDSVKEIERNLNELHQVFLDMKVLVDTQGQQLDDIESQVTRARSYVERGAQELQTARKHQKNTRKWTCYAIILLLVIILFVVLFTVRPWESNGNNNSNRTTPWCVIMWSHMSWLVLKVSSYHSSHYLVYYYSGGFTGFWVCLIISFFSFETETKRHNFMYIGYILCRLGL